MWKRTKRSTSKSFPMKVPLATLPPGVQMAFILCLESAFWILSWTVPTWSSAEASGWSFSLMISRSKGFIGVFSG